MTAAPGRRKRAEPDAGGYCGYLRAACDARWRTLWALVPAAIAGEDIEAVHDVRVASRRLRAAMDAAAPCFSAPWFAPLHRAARDITAALGEVRDRDVQMEKFWHDLAAATPAEAPGIERLIARLDRERAEARVAMERYLAGLLEGPLPAATAKRFGSAPAPSGDDAAPAEAAP